MHVMVGGAAPGQQGPQPPSPWDQSPDTPGPFINLLTAAWKRCLTDARRELKGAGSAGPPGSPGTREAFGPQRELKRAGSAGPPGLPGTRAASGRGLWGGLALPIRVHESSAEGFGDGLGARLDAELGVDVGQVVLDRLD